MTSFVIWITNNRTFFYFVGLIELVLIIIALVSNIMQKVKSKNSQNENVQAESLNDNDNSEISISDTEDNSITTDENNPKTEE